MRKLILVLFVCVFSFSILSSVVVADNSDEGITYQTRARFEFKTLTKDTLKKTWRLPSSEFLKYDVVNGALQLSSSLKSTSVLYTNTVKTYAISPEKWYKIELDGHADGHLSAFIFFEGYDAKGAKIQAEYFNSAAKTFLIRTAANVTRFKMSIRLAGEGTLNVNKFMLYEVISNSHSLDWTENKSKILNYLETVNMSKLVKGYDSLLPVPLNRDYLASANRIVNENIIPLYILGEFKLGNGWISTENNSYKRFLHGHFFVPDLVKSYKETGNREYIDKAINIIKDWVVVHPYGNSPDIMAWHDETTARRLMAWIQLYDASKRIIDESTAEFLVTNIIQHGQLLSQSKFYKKLNNHGMFQDQALMIYSDYFSVINDNVILKLLAMTRMNEYFTYVISDEGVHLEHSPSYHQEIARSIVVYKNYFEDNGEPYGEQLDVLYQKMMKFATFIIKPDGYFPQVGDTSYGKAKPLMWDDPNYAFAVTKGQSGIAPVANEAVFLNSGYAILRNRWEKDSKGTYILFTAAYHSGLHKHNDDLSLWLYHNQDIIIESGPNGYDYNNEFTKYSYSSFAHNTLIVDDNGLPSTPKIDKKYNETRLTNHVSTEEKTIVTGVNERYTGVKHERTIEYVKNTNVLNVTDNITSATTHGYKVLWNLAPNIEPQVEGNTVTLLSNNAPVMKMDISTVDSANVELTVVKGQKSPYLLGWYLDKFYDDSPTPINVLVIEFEGSSSQISTKFTPLN